MSTPSVAPGTTPTWKSAPAESPKWMRLLNALLPTRPLTFTKQKGKVQLTRNLEPNSNGNEKIIWTKTYLARQRPGDEDYSIFNDWENTLIRQANTDGVASVYKLYELVDKGHESTITTMGATPNNKGGYLKTHHAGIDLDTWCQMRCWSGGSQRAHAFIEQQNFLKLVRAILRALDEFHHAGFIHCDFHFGNLALPAVAIPLDNKAHSEDAYQVTPDFERIKIFDLGYSLHQDIGTPVALALSPWELDENGRYILDAAGKKIPAGRMSPRLHAVLDSLHTLVDNNPDWPESERYSRQRWIKHKAELKKFNELDWREDLYQFGYWLATMRDGKLQHSSERVDLAPSNLPSTLGTQLIHRLPEELMAWAHAPKPDKQPHRAYIERIDKALLALPPLGGTFVVRRSDHDSAYRTYLDEQRRAAQKQAAEQAAKLAALHLADDRAWQAACVADTVENFRQYLKDWPQGAHQSAALATIYQFELQLAARLQAEQAEKERQRQLARQAFIKTALRAGVLTAGVAGTIGLGVIAWSSAQENLGEIQAAQKLKEQAALDAARKADQQAKERAARAAEQAAKSKAKKLAIAAMAAKGEQALLVKYNQQTGLIQASNWWLKGRSSKLKPNAEQTEWVQNTLDYATQKNWPSAQFVLGQLYCSGAHRWLAVQSMQACGQWVGAALSNADFNTALDASQRSALANAAVAQFDYVVYGPKAANGLAQGALPGYSDFAQAILPGLLARKADFPALAIRAAHVQACNLQPPQRSQAEQTLITLIQQNQDVDNYAQGWLNQWRNGDYSRCNTDIHRNEA